MSLAVERPFITTAEFRAVDENTAMKLKWDVNCEFAFYISSSFWRIAFHDL